MDDPRIIPPRVDFLDQRTNKISREWFLWLLRLVGKENDTEVIQAFDKAIGSAQIGELRKDVAEVAYQATLPPPAPLISKRDIQDARLPEFRPSLVGRRDLQDLRLVNQINRGDAELTKRVDGISIQLAQLNAMASGFAAKIAELQLQLAMQTQVSPYWTMGQVNSITPTSPDRTLTVAVGGTKYYIHAKTTND